MADPVVRAFMALARATAHKRAPVTWIDEAGQRGFAAEEAVVVAALAAWFATPAAIAAVTLPVYLVAELVGLGIPADAAREAGELTLSVSLAGRSRYGVPVFHDGMSVTRRVAAEEPVMRARYLLAAARRLAQGLADADYDAAMNREQRYLTQHVDAGRKRRAAAAAVDEVAAKSGPWMVWRTAGDDRVTPDCAMLEGRIFTVDNPPDGKVPGARHLRCRCSAAPWGSPLFKVSNTV